MGKDMDVSLLAGCQGIQRAIHAPDINRPGLALSGYLDYFAADRVQILGNTEIHFMERMKSAELFNRLERLFAFDVPVFILSRNLKPRNVFLDICNRRGVPVLQCSHSTDEVISRTILFLTEEFCPETSVHGVAIECYGVGCLIVGKAGVGKSETALELVERGHRLVADDVVTLRRRREDALYAESNSNIKYHMEIRGLGIIDIQHLFGVGAIRESKRISLVVELEEWRQDSLYDRTGLKDEEISILGVSVPHLHIPVRPGRNIAIILEVAALNHRLKEMGYHPAKMLNDRLIENMKNNSEKL